MLFNSYEYLLLFLPTVVAVFFLLNYFASAVFAKAWLVAASLAFYSWWGLAYLPLIIISIFINYCVGTVLGTTRLSPFYRTALLTAGIGFNVGLLAYFKYANFLVDNINSVVGTSFQLDRIALPLAISFFTFQKIAYLVDSYRGETQGYNFLNYALFVTFFPQLIAGPIVHHKEVVPQFSDPKNSLLKSANVMTGLSILSIGLFKKVMIADTFAVYASAGFDTGDALRCIEAWTASLGYSFQLYFDFSGYTDMAIGSALILNIRLPNQFQFTVSRNQHPGFLATLAHHAKPLSSRLCLHTARRKQIWRAEHVFQFIPDVFGRRALAWGQLDIRHLGAAFMARRS